MNRFRFSCFLVFLIAQLSVLSVNAKDFTPTGILLDADWKVKLYSFSEQNLKHPSWGLAHSERNYWKSRNLAEKEGVSIDSDVLFASAFLHDLGGLPPYSKPGVDHAVRSAEVAAPLLESFGFPIAKIQWVKTVILAHTYYGKVEPISAEARVFHDADLLDFLGTMGISRIFGATSELSPTQTLVEPTKIIEKFAIDIPVKLVTKSAQRESVKRVREMRKFLKTLNEYSLGRKAL